MLLYKSGMDADPLQQNYNIHVKMSLDTQTSKRQEVIAGARGSVALLGGVLHQCAVVSLKKVTANQCRIALRVHLHPLMEHLL